MDKWGFEKEKINWYYNSEDFNPDDSYLKELFCDDTKIEKLRWHLSGQFNEIPEDEEVEGVDFDRLLYKIHYNINTTTSVEKVNRIWHVTRMAMSLAGAVLIPLVVLMGIRDYKTKSRQQETWVEVKAPAWTRTQFSLPDGTRGWLNSNSSIKYNGRYLDGRKVSLSGEAYFDVVSDSKRPFVVNTKDLYVKVLGTKFNIASYENEKNIEIVLEEGKLEINDKSFKNTFTLKPDDLVLYDRTTEKFTSEVVQTHKYTSWTAGRLIFRNDPLDVVARRLARWYNVDVGLNATNYQDLRWRATFVDDSLEEVLSALKRSLHVEYRIVDQKIDSNDIYSRKKVILTLNP